MIGTTELFKQREAKGASGMSPILQALLSAMSDAGVSCCYFKSVRRLELALSGRSDFDLLVARKDRERVLKLLAEHCFKHWHNCPARDHPAIMSFLGYDEATGRIHHVHVHFRLVLGHALLKDFRLPLEEEFLARSVPCGSPPIRVLDAADEALLLLVRAHVELHWLDPTTWHRRKEIRQKFSDDFAELRNRVDRDVLLGRAEQIFSPQLARALVSAFPGIERRSSSAVRAAIFRELGPFRTYNPLEANLRRLLRTMAFVFGEANRRVLKRPRVSRRLAPGGGVVISFIGVDGSGKSTQVSAVKTWLAGEIDVVTYYFGTGDGRPSLVFLPFKRISPLVAAFLKSKSARAGSDAATNRGAGLMYALLVGIWALVVALDKQHKIRSARRAASRGLVVLTDRYPQNEIGSFNDGPILSRNLRAPRWLRRFESSVYELARRTPPDLVIKLRATAEVLTSREPRMNQLHLRQLMTWLDDLEFRGARVACVDATSSLSEVAKIVRRAVWKSL